MSAVPLKKCLGVNVHEISWAFWGSANVGGLTKDAGTYFENLQRCDSRITCLLGGKEIYVQTEDSTVHTQGQLKAVSSTTIARRGKV